jgi:outer membrane protein OmpA-like peptidoglycan-associated protein
MRASILLLTFLTALVSCASPPKPPTVDESRRHPVNVASAVELQVCESDLQNTRILVTETTHLAESASATATKLALQLHGFGPRETMEATSGNVVYVVHFAFGSARVGMDSEEATALIAQARTSPLILLRARTDGDSEDAAESRIARERAIAVRSYLVQSGIDPTHIRMTWQAVGDAVADNTTVAGRSANRRVEIELYRHTPEVIGVRRSAS